ncbi:MAG: radical SAM protein [Acidobacteriota bacterium]|nr:radical SAM protein [Acidobacteriota bacterium]
MKKNSRAGETRRHVYGPVPSRRLGYSLGIDILRPKTCTIDCVYCQLGRTPRKTVRRGDFVDVEAVLAQVRAAVESGRRIDHITFSGSGEPTLNRSIGRIVRAIKDMTDIPVVVLTNGTLLHRRDVRRDILAADIVVPSLDAATSTMFGRVNRPHASLTFDKMIAGLKAFRRGFPGQIWLEVMLLKGLNDGPAHLRKLKALIAEIEPDKVHLNTAVRPPAEKTVRALSREDLETIRDFLGGTAEVIADFHHARRPPAEEETAAAVLDMVRRRPVTIADIAATLGRHPDEIRKTIDVLISEGRVRPVRRSRRIYYTPAS